MENVQLNVARNVLVTLDIISVWTDFQLNFVYKTKRPSKWFYFIGLYREIRIFSPTFFMLGSINKITFCRDRKWFEWIAKKKLHASHFPFTCVWNFLFLLISPLHNITIQFEQSYWQPIPANAHFIVFLELSFGFNFSIDSWESSWKSAV